MNKKNEASIEVINIYNSLLSLKDKGLKTKEEASYFSSQINKLRDLGGVPFEIFQEIRSNCKEIFYSIKTLSENEILNVSEIKITEKLNLLIFYSGIPFSKKFADELHVKPGFANTSILMNKIMFNDGVRRERMQAEFITASPNPWEVFNNRFGIGYEHLVTKEYVGANLKSNAKIVFLGSGPAPITLILFWKLFGVKSIGVEINSETADISRKLINSLDLNDQITIITGDHFSKTIVEECDHLIIASDAEPKEEIFNQLAETLPNGKTLSYRLVEPKNDNQTTLATIVLNKEQEFFLHPSFQQYRYEPPSKNVLNTIIFIRKQEEV